MDAQNNAAGQGSGPESTYWRPIPGHEGFEFGDAMEVRRISPRYRRVEGPGFMEYRYEAYAHDYVYMKHSRNTQGYLTVNIGFPKNRVPLSHLVAFMAYGRWPAPGEIVRHLDDDRLNNYAGNIAFGTQRDNVRDSIRNGKHSSLHQGAWRRGVPIKQRRRAV